MNFSYSLLHERTELVQYFTQVRASLTDDGIFVIDCHGGASAARSDTHKRRPVELAGGSGQFDYEWSQESWDPISAELLCGVSFHFQDGSSIAPAFQYRFRRWGLAELADVLRSAGFTEIHTYWPDADEDGQLTGTFSPALFGTDDETWTCYLMAEK